MSHIDQTPKSVREFQIKVREIIIEHFNRSLSILMLGNSGGLALTIGIAGALVGGGFSPLPTLWPALSFCAGLLVSAAQPIIGTWRLLRFRVLLETMMNPDADLTQLEDDAKEELKKSLGDDASESDPGFLIIPKMPSFLPIVTSSILFIGGLIGGMIGLYYL